MNNLSLNFFGEKVNIKIPETLANLRQQISEKFFIFPFRNSRNINIIR